MPLSLWVVEAREERPPRSTSAICWRLLTTLPVETVAAAVEKVRWYAQRWVVEVLHKVLKSGCQIEQRQLESAVRLQRVLMLDLIVAWRILALCRAGRATPDVPARQWLVEAKWRALWGYVHQRAKAAASGADGAASGAMDRPVGGIPRASARWGTGANRGVARPPTPARNHGCLEALWS